MTKISVIIPTYNVEGYIAFCLDSVLNQSLRDIEVICVDDGSTDGTVQVLREYEKKDPRVQVILQDHSYAGVARNRGMEAAKGEYLAFLDGDDYYVDGALERCYTICKTHDLDMLKVSSYMADDVTGEVCTNDLYRQNTVTRKNQVLSVPEDMQEITRCRDVPWNGLYKRSFLENNAIRFSSLRCSNDHSFFMHCAMTAKRVMVTEDFMVCYRVNRQGSLITHRHRYFDSQIENYRIVERIARNCSLTEQQMQVIMRKELYLVFHWYRKLLEQGVNLFAAEEILGEFVDSYDPAYVGSSYVQNFSYKHLYRRMQERNKIQWQGEESKQEPYFSVIVPVHNATMYLSECLDSILLQDFRDFELLCVDNNSTDESLPYLQDYAQKDRRIRVLTEEHPGAGLARNLGIREARGKYLVFVDADDKILPDYLSVMAEQCRKHQPQVLALDYSNLLETEKCYPVISCNKGTELLDIPFSYKEAGAKLFAITIGAPWAKAYEREFICRNKMEFLGLMRTEDFYFVYSALVQAERIVYHRNFSYHYRKDNVNGLENNSDLSPVSFWDATLMLKEHLQSLSYYKELEVAFLHSAVRRFSYNFFRMNSYEGFCKVFYLLKEVAESDLQLSNRKLYKEVAQEYAVLKDAVSYDRAEDYLYEKFLERKGSLRKHKEEMQLQKRRYEALKHSAEYRAGRVLLFVPRKIVNACSFLGEHGLRMTLDYGLGKIRRIFFRKK